MIREDSVHVCCMITDSDGVTKSKPSFEYLPTSLPHPPFYCKSTGDSSSSTDIDPNSLDCVPCDCQGPCDSMCGHTVDLDDAGPTYLCNNYCPCPADCANRLSSTDVSCAVRYDQKKGWCLKSRHNIPSGTYIGDYTGLLVGSTEAEAAHSCSRTNYILTIREQSTSGCLTTHIDATSHGTPLRFMNHSCEPNVRVVPMRDDHVYPRATCWTCRGVVAGEELCISYGEGELGTVKCLCGSDGCAGFLPLESFRD